MKTLQYKLASIALIVGLLFSVLPFVGSVNTAEAAVSSWQKGASIQSRSAGDFASESFKQSVRNLQATGANYVSLIIPYYQSNLGSTDIAPGWNTPSDATLISAINFIHSLGMKVMLKPHLESNDGQWRAYINPGDRNSWFANYGSMLNHVADIGSQTGAEAFCIGTELINMATYTSNGDNTQRWQSLITGVRNRYSGHVTYSANWGGGDFGNEKAHIGFWPQLDSIGMSAYFELYGGNDVNSLKSAWDNYNWSQIKSLSDQFGKPVLFTEVGYRSVGGAHNQPWNSGMGGGYDPQGQVNLYQALFEYWNNQPFMIGVHLWEWKSDPNAGGSGNTDYTPQQKPAENVLKQWFGSPTTPTPNPTSTPPTIPPSGNSVVNGTFQADGAVMPSSPIVNQGAPLKGTVHINGTASNVIVDMEVYNSANLKVHQQFFENESFTTNQTKQYSANNWIPTQPGTYTLKIGVFSNTWGQNYFWDNDVVTFTVGTGTPPPPPPPPTSTTTPPTPPPPPPSGTATTNIWWPTDGVSVNGTQPFKAMLEGRDVSQYSMFWQVDGDRLNEMFNSNQDYPHKEANVDVSGWTWKGAEPYNINFVSKDSSGNTISQKSINIFVR